jgi:hypothetical protein
MEYLKNSCAIFLAVLLWSGCAPSTQDVESSVRAFAQTVAHDVTAEGPVAWERHFSDSPSFFMAVNGQMAFANRAAVTSAMPELLRMLPHIELKWGDDLRVDPLSADLATVASSYHEVQTRATGERVEESGFFTGTAERRGGRWQFRNAHWSGAVPSR